MYGICANTIGSFQCTCQNGFSGNGVTCVGEMIVNLQAIKDVLYCMRVYTCNLIFLFTVDVDECEEEIDGCDQICNNTEGSFFCSCMMGYSLADDQFNCSGKDVKSEAYLQQWTSDILTIDTLWVCLLGNAFVFIYLCLYSDVNECDTGDHNCDSNGFCVNNIGSFLCFCDPGYTGEGTIGTCQGMY